MDMMVDFRRLQKLTGATSMIRNTGPHVTLTLLILALIGFRTSSADDVCAVSKMPNGSHCTCNTTEADGQRNYQINCINAGLRSVPGDLPDLPTMRFQGNDIQILDYISHTALKELFLDDNNIRFIKDLSFRDLGNLEHLHLESNKISGLSNNTFYGLSSLKTLYLKQNRLYELQNETFSGKTLPSLKILILSDCQLVHIAANAFKGATSLTMLDLSNNMLTSPIQFLGHLKIDTLILSSNRLENLANSPFQQLKFTEKLFISSNRITNLTATDFKGLSRLTILSLNNNSISSVDISALRGSDRLTELDLSTNQLKTVRADCFSWSSLAKLYVYDNPWDCGCETQWLYDQHVVVEWNLNSNLKCASPSSVAGKPVFSVDDHVFDCPHGHNVTIGAIIGIVVGAVLAIIGSILLYKLVVKKKINTSVRSRSNGVSVSTTSSYSRVQDSRELFDSCVESNVS